MKNIIGILNLVAIILVGGFVWINRNVTAIKERIVVNPKKIIQQQHNKPIVINRFFTKQIFITNEKIKFLFTNYNEFATKSGWISVSNNSIYAGLHIRSWKVKYGVKDYRHEISTLFGGAFAVQYSYLFFKRLSGKIQIQQNDRDAKVLAGAGWKF